FSLVSAAQASPRESRSRCVQVVGGMMAARVADDLVRGADKTCDFPDRSSVLKQPSDTGVPEDMRCHVLTESAKFSRSLPVLTLLGDQSASVFDRSDDRHSTPALEVWQHPVRDRSRHASLVAVRFAFATPIQDAAI